MKIRQNSLTLSYFLILIKTILFLLITSLSFANENKIGSVTELKGTIVAITEELDERDLLIHDPIFLNEEIFVSEGSSATIQFNDNTAIIMRELTSINVSEFENSKKNPKLKAELVKGKIIIESGSIAKKDNGEMIVGVTTSSLGLRGTRVDIDLKPGGKSNISLATDSFGNVGEIKVNSDGQISNITSTEQVLEISENNETISRDKTVDEKEEEKSVNDSLIQSSKIDEEEITKQLQKKLEDGNLQDANNDGIVNELDIDETRKQITNEKKQKIEFIVDNSKDENTNFLSDVIDQSDEKSTGEVIEKIIEIKDNLVEGVVGNLADKDNKFLTSSTSESAALIKEKIFETIVTKETDKSAEILSKVMAKSDEATISSVINNITEKNTNEESKLSLKVMADFSEKNPEKLENLNQNNSEQIEKLTISAVEKAESSQQDADLIAKVVSVASDELVNKVIEEVSKNSKNEKEALSAKVMKSIASTNPNKIKELSDENKDTIIQQSIDAAKNQNDNKDDESNDLSDVIADIIVTADPETSGKLIQKLDKTELDEDSDLNLSILDKLSKKDLFEEKLEIISIRSKLNEVSIKNFIRKGIEDANNEENTEKITKVIEISESIVNENIIESGEENEATKKKVVEIITKVIEKNPEKAIEILEKNKKTKKISKSI
ncbi:FecR domain-containing protein, partial [Candidatus Pelagibacter sp.]|nr:FecR domain-containing protein [Candidatus Pelagibacter sp.]